MSMLCLLEETKTTVGVSYQAYFKKFKMETRVAQISIMMKDMSSEVPQLYTKENVFYLI